MKTVLFTPTAQRQIEKLDRQTRERVYEKLERYAETGAGNVKALSGQPGARLRIGDYRAIFDETADAIEVRAVGHRREIYD